MSTECSECFVCSQEEPHSFLLISPCKCCTAHRTCWTTWVVHYSKKPSHCPTCDVPWQVPLPRVYHYRHWVLYKCPLLFIVWFIIVSSIYGLALVYLLKQIDRPSVSFAQARLYNRIALSISAVYLAHGFLLIVVVFSLTHYYTRRVSPRTPR